MWQATDHNITFPALNTGYARAFAPGRMTLGLVVPLERYAHTAAPTMTDHIERVQLAEQLGFAAVWLRDVPFDVPSFGDAGQLFDPFVYLGTLAAVTDRITLGVASLILPLRHPAHVAKAAASVDVLSGGRLVLGIASGDRPAEYPAMGVDFEARGARFRESYEYIRNLGQPGGTVSNAFGEVSGNIDLLPRPVAAHLPLLTTGSSQQNDAWIAANTDGWMTYPRPAAAQGAMIASYRARVAASGDHDKPVMEPLYIDLAEDPDAPPSPIHLGIRAGARALRDYLRTREHLGVNHVALNLRFANADTEAVLEQLSEHVLPHFPTQESDT
ncbi:MAG: LLM class oxidoreductase [Pseudomonadota bacterium]